MRLIFMGNGPFAVPALRQIHESSEELLLVVARPGYLRGPTLVQTGPIKDLATSLGYEVAQPESANDPSFVETLRSRHADLLVVVDFGQILSPDCLGTTQYGGINIHASLLPKYRGAAPIVWAVYNGESETGVSIIQMTPRLDAGGVLVQQAIPIGPDETNEQLEKRLADLGGKLAMEAITLIQNGQANPLPQSDQLATKAPRVRKEHGLIDWSRSAKQIHNQVRAMIPWPIAYTQWVREAGEPLRLQILHCQPLPQEGSQQQSLGSVVQIDKDRIYLQTGDGILAVDEVKPAGKRAMSVCEFLRGQKVLPGQRFE